MRVSPIQESFSGGEVDARVRGRVTSDAYKTGLKRCRNWRPLVQGPVSLREGSAFMEYVDSNNWISGTPGVNGIRTFTFQRGIDNDAIVEVGEAEIKVRDSITGEVIVGGESGNLIHNAAYNGWDFDASHCGVFPENQSCCIIWGVPNSIYDCDRAKDVAGTLDPGVFDGQINGDQSTHKSRDACPGYDIQGSHDATTPDAQITLITQCGPQTPDPYPSAGNPVYLGGVNDGWHSPAWENATPYPFVVPAGSELLLNELNIDWQAYLSPFQISTIGAYPVPDWVIRVDIGTTKGASDVFTSDITITNGDRQITTLNFVPGGGNNNLYISIYMAWTGGAIVPNLKLAVGLEWINTVQLTLFPLLWTAPLAGGSGTPVSFASVYTAAQLECLQVCMDPGEQVMYFTHPEVETMRLRLDTGEWTFEALSAITLPTPFVAPTPNNWSTGNYPGACAFHEGRLWLGGSISDPSTLWASRSGDYVDFDNTTPAAADDPLLFPLSSAGTVQTLTSRKELVINTDISEVVGTSVSGVIQFDDFSFPKQTDWGSNCITPIVIGRDMVYTSNSRTRVRTFNDEGGTNYGWDGNELSLLAADIFGQPVRRMVYLDEPAYQACFLLANGTMAMATFFYPENVIGWWLYTTAYNGDRPSGRADGSFGHPAIGKNNAQSVNQIMDICKINTSKGAKLWMLVNRVGFSGTQTPVHEVVTFDDSIVPRLDSYSTSIVDPITGVALVGDHLTDQVINVVVEVKDPTDPSALPQFTVHPNITAVVGFSSVFEEWAWGQKVYAGLFYENDIQLLSLEGVSNRGTSQSSKRRWNKVYARLNDSAKPLIEGVYPKDRTPSTFMGGGEPLTTGDVEIVDLGSGEGDLSIEQDRPLRTEITAIFGKVSSTEV